MSKERVTESEARFKASVKECNRIHGKVNGCIEKKEIAVLKVLKSETEECKKALEEDYRCLVEVGVDETYYDEFVEIKDQFLLLTVKVNSILENLNVVNTSDLCQRSGSQGGHNGLKLPKFELSSFSGNINDWLTYKEIFNSSIIQNKQLSDIERFQYLNASLKGAALQLVKGFSISESNFKDAWQTLTNRFDNKYELANVQINKVFNLKPIKAGSSRALHELLDACNEALRNLKNLGYDRNNTVDLILINVLQGKIDDHLRQLFQLTIEKGEEPKYDKFIAFLEKHARSLQSVKEPSVRTDVNKVIPKKTVVNNSTLQAPSNSCLLCKQNHILCKCEKFLRLPVDQRWALVKQNNCCFNCLRANHRVSSCLFNTQCRHCSQKHHSLLHNMSNKPAGAKEPVKSRQNKIFKQSNQGAQEEQSENSSQESNQNAGNFQCFSTTNSDCDVLLSTAMIKVKGKGGEIKMCRVLIDNGSQKSLISRQCCTELGLTLKESHHTICGINNVVAETSFHQVNVQFAAHFNTKWMYLDALVVNKVTADLPNFRVPKSNWPHIENLRLADPDYSKTRSVDLLLGADIYAELLIGCPIQSKNGSPTAINSKLGFLLSGKIATTCSTKPFIINCHAQLELNTDLQRFWELESVPKVNVLSPDDQQCEEIYSTSVQRDNTGKYIVHLPFKPKTKLGETKSSALRRFMSTEKKLNRDGKLRKEYNKFMEEYLSLGHMEKCTDSYESGPMCYLPHHGVINETSTTTRLRVVFDASMKSSLGNSLNETMFTGPKLQSDLIRILLKFRTYPVALSGDIEKMYRQIWVHPAHCNYQKIFWRFSPHDPLEEYKLLTVTYGFSSAPYLAIRTLHQLATDEASKFPTASGVVLRDFYVDDLLTGTNTIQEAQDLVEELNCLMQCGGFKLRKWSSNCPKALNYIPDDCKSTASCVNIEEDQSHKVLGIKWNTRDDMLQIKYNFNDTVKSKRSLLSVIARIFDPLGFLSPSTVLLKIMLQDLWRDQLSWDDLLPNEIQERWSKFSSEIPCFDKIQVPRCLQSTSCSAVDFQLVGFSDASSRAYAAVFYLRTTLESGKVQVTLIAAKTRVAPVKSITLPKLELCGALLLAELYSTLCSVLSFKISSTHLFSDSQIVLHWINTEPSTLSTFVSHRVAQIQNLTSGAFWNHVCSNENPADCASRGILPEALLHHPLWWTGPPWLSQKAELSHDSHSDLNLSALEQEEFQAEIKSKKSISHLTQVSSTPEFFNKFSAFSKLFRVVAYCLRFVHNLRRQNELKSENLSAVEIQRSIIVIIKVLQASEFANELKLLRSGKPLPSTSPYLSLSPFLAPDGLIRVGGRLTHSNLHFDTKHPMLIPKSHYVTDLIINYYHKLSLHAGTSVVLSLIRQKFWFLSGRDKTRQVLRKCLICFKLNARTSHQIMGNLPKDRITPSRPFLKTGVDFAGPIVTKPNLPRTKVKLKSYIALFVCFATKAVHLELVSDLSTNSFIACLNRFISRRGLPSDMYSDNGTNFRGTDNYLRAVVSTLQSYPVQDFVTQKSIIWHFSPPSGPHFGGLWEANIKSTKRHIVKVCNSALLSFEEMSTLLAQVEACLNSRPLSPLNSDPNDLEPLTPAHFLIGSPLLSLPEVTPTYAMSLRSRWALVQDLRKQFWSRWMKDYLHHLQVKSKWTTPSANIQVGDLVLVKNDAVSTPLQWPLARVMEVFPGSDGIVRVVTVKGASGILKRPISKLCPLPID